MGVPSEKSDSASWIIYQELEYLSRMDPEDIYSDTRARLTECAAMLNHILNQVETYK